MPLSIPTRSKEEIIGNLPEGAKVLDVGGAGAPCLRADYIIDVLEYEQMSAHQTWGGNKQRFTKDTWVVWDICSHKPWPFPDKYFDYVICSHVLEDIRDPIWVCSELERVSKAGYIESPSYAYETAYGIEGKMLAGACHHRWFIDEWENKLRFTFKYSWVHLPWVARKKVPKPEDWVIKRVWEGSFEFFENHIHESANKVVEFLTQKPCSDDDLLVFMAKLYGYPPFLYKFYRKNKEKFALLKKPQVYKMLRSIFS